jgi:hypothetical protein
MWIEIKTRACSFLSSNQDSFSREFPPKFIDSLIQFHSLSKKRVSYLMIFAAVYSLGCKIILISSENPIIFLEDEMIKVIRIEQHSADCFVANTILL